MSFIDELFVTQILDWLKVKLGNSPSRENKQGKLKVVLLPLFLGGWLRMTDSEFLPCYLYHN